MSKEKAAPGGSDRERIERLINENCHDDFTVKVTYDTDQQSPEKSGQGDSV